MASRGLVVRLLAVRIVVVAAMLAGIVLAATVLSAGARAQASFDLAARKGLQDALIWSGDYSGAVNGSLGRPTREAIRRFQARIGARPTGEITAPEAERLIAEAERSRRALGYDYEADVASGAVIGLPKALVAWRGTAARGARYADAAGEVEIETFRMPAGETTLPALYAKLSASSGRRVVSYSAERASWFVVSGTEGSRRFYVRVHRLLDGDLLGVSLAYPVRQSARLDRLAVAMSNDFAAAVAWLDERSAGAAPQPGALLPGSYWIVVASRSDLTEAIGVAEGFRAAFPETFVARTMRGVYAVVTGRATTAEWRAIKGRLIASGAVPADSFLMNGDKLASVAWRAPPGGAIAATPPSAPTPSASGPAAAATVRVEPTPPAPPPAAEGVTGSGTGFLVSERHLITNAHVVDGCGRVSVAAFGTARIAARDARNDLALLEIALPSTATPLLFAPEPTKLGAAVAALGYPLRQYLSPGVNITTGIVSSLAGIGGDSRYLQISAAVQPGNSGGPLVDDHGHVVGVVAAKLDTLKVAVATGDVPQSVNFAIRKEVVQMFLAANGIAMPFAPATVERLEPQEIAEQVAPATLIVECW